MVRHTVLGGPVEEDEHSGHRFGGAVQPEAALLEPLHSEDAAGEFGVGSAVQVATLVGTPADKAGAPLYMIGKSVPAPIGFAAYVAHLGQGYIHNGIPVLWGVEHFADWVVPQHMGDILLVSIPQCYFSGTAVGQCARKRCPAPHRTFWNFPCSPAAGP